MCKLKSFALHPKLTQHCKSIFNRHFRKFKKKNECQNYSWNKMHKKLVNIKITHLYLVSMIGNFKNMSPPIAFMHKLYMSHYFDLQFV